MTHDWLIPDWPAPSTVQAICTTRGGGFSAGPYASLNLGDHVGDDAHRVAQNRGVLRDRIQAQPVFLQQVHGSHAVALTAATPDGTQADACFTGQPGVACTIMVADCLPVLLTDVKGRAVAAAHAGWRGLAGGVLETAFRNFSDMAGAVPQDVMVWLGPCIGPAAFEVGDEVKAAFEAQDETAGLMFSPHAPGKWMADLQGLARLRLQRLGITRIHGNDGSDAWCTVNNPSRFFSHRRDGVSGRFAACIWRV
ncbi:MAG: peptidoglycan editing factor PgeF [Comamonadaceae bacterium]|nr:MAG: peptidoglycan editing factor PgeF [Comamonadaceae bacterium]